MVNGRFRAYLKSSLGGILPPLALAIWLFLPLSATGQTSGFYRSPDESAYQKEVPSQRWIASNHKQNKWRKYEDLSPEEKARLQKKYKEWKSLPPQKRKVLRQRMDRLKAMPPEDRERYKQRFDQWQKLSPEERRKIRQKLQKWDHLPPEEKKKIRRRFQN